MLRYVTNDAPHVNGSTLRCRLYFSVVCFFYIKMITLVIKFHADMYQSIIG